MNGSVSLKTIAAELRLSVDTVSKALRDSSQISEATKKLVRSKANELGYVKNSLAVSLKMGTTKNVAVFINDLYNPYFAIMVDKIVRLLEKHGYTGFISLLNGYDLNLEGLNSFFTNKCSLAISLVDPMPEVVKTFKDNGIPFFLIGIKPDSDSVNYAITDDYEGGRLAGECFVGKGFRKGLFLTNSPSETSIRRERGFLDYCAGLDVSSLRYDDGKIGLADAANLIKEKGFDFVFCHSDYVAISLRRFLRKIGHSCFLLGYDNISQYVDLYDPVSSIGTDVDMLVNDVVTRAVEVHQGKADKGEVMAKVYKVSLFDRG